MPTRNKLLAALTSGERESLLRDVVPIELALKQTLHEPDRTMEHVYFPLSGVVSLVNEPEPGQVVEFATVGCEGVVGMAEILSAEATMPSRSFVQVPGEAIRLPVRPFNKAVAENSNLRALLMRYTLALLTQIAQSTSCNRLHEVQERCARWLLQTHDRVEGNSFALTQEFLAQMLGVHRPTVTVAAGMLQQAGLIEYTRGSITVINRKGLEAASCSCYGIIRREYDRLLGTPRGS